MALIRDVSDTARWIAAHRALESSRSDALFRDPFADRLAGERGREIMAGLAPYAGNGWSFLIRTKVIDDLVMECVAAGCDTVVNLASGFDVRPYRLALPKNTVWMEADLPAIIAEKRDKLNGETPRCELVFDSVDLANGDARRAFLQKATARSANVAVITEGLLSYLEDDAVRDLARDIHSAGVRFWVLDLWSPAIRRRMRAPLKELLSNAPFKFAPPDGVAFFEILGWEAVDIRSLLREGLRLRRVPLAMQLLRLLPNPNPRALRRSLWVGGVRLART